MNVPNAEIPICTVCGQSVNLVTDWPHWDRHLGLICRSHAWPLQEAHYGFTRKSRMGEISGVIDLLETSTAPASTYPTALAIAYLADYAALWDHYNTPIPTLRKIRK